IFLITNEFRLRKIHEKNYIHHDLHSGNIFSYDTITNVIGDLGLCQQAVDKKDNPNKIYGVIPYMAPEVLSKKLYTKESDIYSFGMIILQERNLFMIDRTIMFLYQIF